MGVIKSEITVDSNGEYTIPKSTNGGFIVLNQAGVYEVHTAIVPYYTSFEETLIGSSIYMKRTSTSGAVTLVNKNAYQTGIKFVLLVI
jgi:hypothetical protein